MRKAGFKQMIDGTREDYLLLQEYEHPYVAALPDRLLASLESLKGGLQGYPVSRYEHSLQSATRALRDGADRELWWRRCCTTSATICRLPTTRRWPPPSFGPMYGPK